jgi:hypothetical protein
MASPSPDMTLQLVGGGTDWLGSIASIVGALAWPAVIISCVVLFRTEIRAILSRVTSFGIGSVTAQVDQNLRATEVLSAATASEGTAGPGLTEEQSETAEAARADRAPAVTDPPLAPSEQPTSLALEASRRARERIRRRAVGGTSKSYDEWAAQLGAEQTLPVGSRMVQAFEPVDELIRELASRHGVPSDLSTMDIVLALGGMGVVSRSFGGLLGSQTQLRNMVAHNDGHGLSEFQARQFIEQIGETRRQLEDLLAPPPV